MTDTRKRYADRDVVELDEAGNYYCRHVRAMTAEGLHSKSDIAAELAWRDREIDRLQSAHDAEVGALRERLQFWKDDSDEVHDDWQKDKDRAESAESRLREAESELVKLRAANIAYASANANFQGRAMAAESQLQKKKKGSWLYKLGIILFVLYFAIAAYGRYHTDVPGRQPTHLPG